MQVTTVQLWRNNTTIEDTSSLSLKQHDTSPNFGMKLVVGGLPYSLVGSTIVSTVRFKMTLKETCLIGSKYLRTSKDYRLLAGDVFFLDDEKMSVVSVDDGSDPGFFRVKVNRAQSSTTEAIHQEGSTINVIVAQRSGIIADTDDNNVAYFKWVAGDTSRAGDFDLEFEITESTGEKYSVPSTPAVIRISSDFNGR